MNTNTTTTTQAELRCLIVDDDSDHLRLLELALHRLDEFDVTVVATQCAQDAADHLLSKAFDLALIDLQLGQTTGDQVLTHARENGVHTPVIVLSSVGDQYDAVRCIKAGAQGYLVKFDINTDRLGEVVQEALAQGRVEAESRRGPAEAANQLECLTPRERQIAELIAEGLLSKQIAAQLGCSEGTVKVHRSHILRKTGANTSAELAQIVVLARQC